MSVAKLTFRIAQNPYLLFIGIYYPIFGNADPGVFRPFADIVFPPVLTGYFHY